MPTITLNNLAKQYDSGAGLRAVSMRVPHGEHLAVVGATGSGKSTLLRLVAGLEAPTSGTIHFDDVDITNLPAHRRGVAVVLQRPALYPNFTVIENLTQSGGGTRPDFAIELLQLAPILNRYPAELSGGETQRVALARAAARPAGVWLLDEPFAALDPVFRAEFRHDLHLLLAESVATMWVVTHDPADAWAFGRRIAVLEGGTLEQLGTAEELREQPASRTAAAALGLWNLVAGSVRGGDSGEFRNPEGSIVAPSPPRRGATTGTESLTLGFLPHDVSLWPHSPETLGASLPAGMIGLSAWSVVVAEPVGSGWLLTLAHGRTTLRARWTDRTPPRFGHPFDWVAPADRGLWFDTHTGRRRE